jgi:tRNA A37 methylthiotransferase MiaB
MNNYKDICNSLIMNDEIFYRKIGDKIELYSYGCPPSIWDLETISSCIDQNKLDDEIVFIDTCCAINLQEDISKKVVDRITSVYPNKTIYITGCGVNYDSEYYKGKGILLDNNKKLDFKNSYKNILKDKINPLDIDHMNGFVKIIDGCNYNCSYCAIKNVRPHKMFSYNEIYQQIKKNIECGIYDIFLFGTEICSYNYDGLNLTKLIKKIINDFPEISSILLDTLNPGFKDMSSLIELIKNENKLIKGLDLGVQSCSDTVLKLMKRPYTVNDIKRIVNCGKGLNINFQLIVGFPGESDELFNESLKVLKELSPNRITFCPFSERKNTEAEIMPNKISHEIAIQRENILVNSFKELSGQNIEKQSIKEFNKFKPIDTSEYHIFYEDLYEKDNFIKIFKTLKDMNSNNDSIIYCCFDLNKQIKELSTNIKLLIVTFGAKVITKFRITDDTIKINFPRLLTYDLLSFIEFEFDKLETTTIDELLTFIKDVKECNIDSKDLITRLSNAGNKELVEKALRNL